VSENDVLLQLGAAQIQIAMAQPKLFGRKRLSSRARYRNRGRDRRPYDFQALGPDFDIAGCEVGVPHLRWARDDLALEEDDTLWTERGCQLHGVQWGEARIE
jgi:hypothetical protein